MFLLRPSWRTNQTFRYCVAYAAAQTGILLHALVVLSNHWHAVLTDPDGRLPDFLACVHKLVAKAQNASLGRWENLWATEPYSAVRLETDADVVAKILYVLSNPAAAGLVRRAKQWPGVLAGPEQYGKPAVALRPSIFFRRNGEMPEQLALRLTPPPGIDDVPQFRRAIAMALDTREKELIQAASASGRAFLGPRGVLAQKFSASPATAAPRRKLAPRVACLDKWRRIEALGRLKAFVAVYREARERWKAGLAAVFPLGTYWLRLHAGVECVPSSA